MQKRKRTTSKKVTEDVAPDLPVYCICRSTDIDRFMIACDRCEEWYHGDCISVTSKQAEQIKTFYCHQCRLKDASLEIVYNSARSQRVRSRQNVSPSSSSECVYPDQPSSVKPNKSKRSVPSSTNQDVIQRKAKLERESPPQASCERKYAPMDPKVSPASIIDGYGDCTGHSSPSLGYFPRNYWSRDAEQFKFEEAHVPSLSQSQPTSKSRAGSPRVRSCGMCSGCQRPEDCGKCDYCRDRRKFGGPNRMRQKCRLRQCMESANSLKSKNSSQAPSSRRRKQQTLQGVLLGSSPSHLPQYADFDDEPFEVPTDFSPRPYADHGTSNVYDQHSANQHIAVGSKMRRGDHRLSHTHELDLLSSRPYRLSLDAAGDAMDLLDDDSDDDVMISGLPHCAGPACMSAPVPGGRYCSESCRVKHTKCGSRSVAPRISMQETAIPYNLPYPDHMYCRHHRVYSWHGNGSVAPTPSSYRAVGPSFDPRFSMDDAHMVETIRQPRGHSSFPYSSGQIHHLSHRIPVHNTSHGSILNAPGRLGMESQGRPVLCDNNDTAAFIDSMESVIRRAVVPLELDIDLPPQHPQSTGAPMSPSPGLTSVNPYYTGRGGVDIVRTAVDLRHMGDSEDGLSHEIDDDGVGDRVTPQSGTHYYYMMSYPGDATNGHSSRMNLDGSTGITDGRMESSSVRARSVNHPLLLHDNPDVPNGIDPRYPPVRALSISSTSLRHSDLSASASATTQESCLGSNVPTNNILPAAGTGISSHSMSTYLPGPEEFYTINDSDDLEINWPQETVAGVNA